MFLRRQLDSHSSEPDIQAPVPNLRQTKAENREFLSLYVEWAINL